MDNFETEGRGLVRHVRTAVVTLLALMLTKPSAGQAPPPGGAPKAGRVLLLRSGTVDPGALTVTVPLLQGRMKDGRRVWYVITDTSDKTIAARRGLNHSPKLGNALAAGTRIATRQRDGALVFESGTVTFGPARTVTPGDTPNPFPPKVAEPGSIGDQDYTPLLRIKGQGNAVYNAPVVAFGVEAKQISFCSGNPDRRLVHDRVVRICPEEGTVTLGLTQGFSGGRAVLYTSMDSSDRGIAAMEAATFAPRLSGASPQDGYGQHSQVEPIFVVINGPRGASNPQRQGLESALTDGGGPLNVVGAIPTLGGGYSPLWSVNLGQWTANAVSGERRVRVTDLSRAMELSQQGLITGPGGKAFGPITVVVNCPIVQRLE